MSTPSIISPKTGKWITVKGQAYQDLLKSSQYATKAKNAKRVLRPKPGSRVNRGGRTTEAEKITLPRTGRPTGKAKGWASSSPRRGTERTQLKAKCGEECFLKPDVNGFPVCAALREGKGCKVDCRGIIAAKLRAGEWKYEHVREVADKLAKKYGCENK